MAVAKESRRRLRRRSPSTALALCLVLCPTAAAAPPASDEYRLDLGEARVNLPRSATPTGELELTSTGGQAGVIGEDEAPASPLSSIATAASQAPVVLLAALAGLGWLALSYVRSRARQVR